MIENLRRAAGDGRMDARHLLLLLLALVPAVSTSRPSWDAHPPTSVSQAGSSIAGHDGVDGPNCRDLRDAELILAEQEVRLIDLLASQRVLPGDRDAWKSEPDDTRASLQDLDRALADARCPPAIRGG